MIVSAACLGQRHDPPSEKEAAVFPHILDADAGIGLGEQRAMATRRARWLVVLGGMVFGLLVQPALAAAQSPHVSAADAAPVRVLTTTEESGCYEVVIPRAVTYDSASALVPPRYTLAQPIAAFAPVHHRLPLRQRGSRHAPTRA
jgi:hypothetical protein